LLALSFKAVSNPVTLVSKPPINPDNLASSALARAASPEIAVFASLIAVALSPISVSASSTRLASFFKSSSEALRAIASALP